MRHRRALLIAAALTIGSAACDAGGTGSPPEPQLTVEDEAAAAAPVDRLLVLDNSGNVVTMNRDGSGVTAITSDADSQLGYFQPSWSPSASSISVSRVDDGDFSLVKIDVATLAESSVPTENNPFYTYWSPAGDRLAYLSTGVNGMGLSIAEFGEEPGSTRVDLGQPFYFAWSPLGDQLATFIGQERLEVRDTELGGPVVEVVPQPGAFQNPAWTDAGLAYISRAGGSGQLVVGSPGQESTVIARIPAYSIFTTTTAGDRIAIQSVGNPDTVGVAVQKVPVLPLNQLVIIEVATGEQIRVTDWPVIAFFWDQAGEKLLVMDIDQAAGTPRWSVWEEGTLSVLTLFTPTMSWAQQYLPFFGQYALSTTMWSPDGTAFAFAGTVGSEQGIFVQEIAGGAPSKVADGSWVLWSPR